ncbi:MAG: O-antigen ligase family protein [Anaerolineae bacterium]|nr:O-antigen ligase family protein [Anaerolineae bacterium]
MKFSILQAKAGTRIAVLVYLLCLVSFAGLSGYTLRWSRFELRGIESSAQFSSDQRLGANIDLTQYTAPELSAALDDLAALRFYWLRQRMNWREIEPEPGQYNWSVWDTIVDAARRHHLGLITVLDDPPDWALRQRPYSLPCVPPIDEQAYARFAAAVAARYGNTIDHYQVWDEPNLSRRWGNSHVAACGYATLLHAAYPAIHAADPTAWVLGGALAPTQAPGPDNLNDLTYLRQLYALDGDAYFDILAVKPYGFWSGPEDRRVEPDVLNFSRVVAAREIMRRQNDQNTPVWAVEWGWNVLPDDYAGPPMPWGGDTAEMQMERIRGAIARVRSEWPWLGPMIWAEYQPDLPVDAPRWSFALRDAQNIPTEIYNLWQKTGFLTKTRFLSSASSVSTHAPLSAIGLILGAALLAIPWFFSFWRRSARESWRAFTALPVGWHWALLAALTALYAFTPHPEWALVAWLLALPIFYLHPTWALTGAVAAIPFHYWAKSFGSLQLAPAEPLLWAAIIVQLGPYRKFLQLAELPASGKVMSPSLPDAVWLLWLLVGTLALIYSPEPVSAWREWRLCILEPVLLYLVIKPVRFEKPDRFALLAGWIVSGLIAAAIGIGQRALGQWVPAGAVGRVTGPFFSPNHLALYLERILALVPVLTLYETRRRRWRRIAVLVMGAALYLTYSRGAWLLAVPAALIAIAWLCKHHLKGWMLAAGLTGLVLVWIALIGGRAQGPLWQEIRLPVWQSALAMIADRPWGVGLDGFQFLYPRYMRPEAWSEPLLYHPHNMWLDATVRLGIPGLIAFALLIGTTIHQMISSIKNASVSQKSINIGLLAGLIAALAHGLVDSGYFLPDLAWSLALVAGLTAGKRDP